MRLVVYKNPFHKCTPDDLWRIRSAFPRLLLFTHAADNGRLTHQMCSQTFMILWMVWVSGEARVDQNLCSLIGAWLFVIHTQMPCCPPDLTDCFM